MGLGYRGGPCGGRIYCEGVSGSFQSFMTARLRDLSRARLPAADRRGADPLERGHGAGRLHHAPLGAGLWEDDPARGNNSREDRMALVTVKMNAQK